MLEGIELFRGHLVLLDRNRGLEELRVIDLATGAAHLVTFPEPAYSVFTVNNREFDTTLLRFSYQSLVTPSSTFDYDMATRERTLLKQQPVLGGYDPHAIRQRAAHGEGAGRRARPPVDRLQAGARAGRPSPAFLYAYGSYGYPLPVTFSSNRLSLLDRGFVVALAHIRGGGELGKPWHDDGRMKNKMNTFTDFIAAAEHLVAERFTSPDRLVIEGGSAGGLLMGAVANMRPDLFKAVVSKVPFVDVINTMSDASLPLTAGEWEEWGNPHVPERIRDHPALRPVHEPRRAGVSCDAGEDLVQRQPGHVLGAGQIRGPAAHAEDGRQRPAPEDQHGRGPRRRLRPLRLPARGRLRLRVHLFAGGDHALGLTTLRSYAAGRWMAGTGDLATLVNPATEEPLARAGRAGWTWRRCWTTRARWAAPRCAR